MERLSRSTAVRLRWCNDIVPEIVSTIHGVCNSVEIAIGNKLNFAPSCMVAESFDEICVSLFSFVHVVLA